MRIMVFFGLAFDRLVARLKKKYLMQYSHGSMVNGKSRHVPCSIATRSPRGSLVTKAALHPRFVAIPKVGVCICHKTHHHLAKKIVTD